MNDEYVPFEEREKREAEQRKSKLHEASRAKDTALAAASVALQRAQASETSAANSYLEVLVPARGLMKRRKPIVQKRGSRGGPDFHIQSVVRAFRIPEAMYEPPFKDASTGIWYDAFVAEDGRVWKFRGSGITDNTWQVLAVSGRTLADLNEPDLARIAAGLSTP